MTELRKPAPASGSRWQSLLRWLLALCSGAVLLCLIGSLVLLAFLWVIHHRKLPDAVSNAAGLILLVVAGLLFWQTMRGLVQCQYRFRLRTLLLVMVVLGAFLAVLGNRLHLAARQHQAIRALWQENSDAAYWFSDVGLMHLRRLDNLERLSIQSSGLTDDGLRHIADLNVTSLSLYAAAGITDESVEHLRSLRRLQSLHVTGSKLTPAGFAELRTALPDCEIVAQ